MNDKWKVYARFYESDFYHSKKIVNPVTGTTTQTINFSWRPLEIRFASRGIRKHDIRDCFMKHSLHIGKNTVR